MSTAASAREPDLFGVALSVVDGDSLVLRTDDDRRLQIRIAGIDAPEKGQPFSDVSRRHLAGLMRDRTLRVAPLRLDRYGRTVADVATPEVDVGLAQIRAGLAWHFERYASAQPPAQRSAYAAAQAQARESRLGLWAEDRPVPPWTHREQQRKARLNRPRAAPPRVARAGSAARSRTGRCPPPPRRSGSLRFRPSGSAPASRSAGA